jgi:hypothetical protein
MSQHDYNIANQGFSSFRSDLNNALSAVQTCNSGTSRPTGAVAGQIWLDTTSATTPTLKYYDGADDISLATLDHSANTVNWLDSTVSVTGLTTTATGTVLTLSDTATTSSVNLIIDNDKEIRFREATANGTNYVSLSAPASLSADLTFTLPATDGTAGQFLSTNGSGVLSFATVGGSATPFAVIGNATAGSEIRLPEDTDNGSNYVAIKAPDTIASNLTLTLPSADGSSGQVLQTNGSGVLSFAGVSASAGQVINVVSAKITSSVSSSSTSFTDVTGLSVSITPSSASNKILILVSVRVGSPENTAYVTVNRDATNLFDATNGFDRYGASDGLGAIIRYDSPATTSSITYKVRFKCSSGSVYMDFGDITIMEIKG